MQNVKFPHWAFHADDKCLFARCLNETDKAGVLNVRGQKYEEMGEIEWFQDVYVIFCFFGMFGVP